MARARASAASLLDYPEAFMPSQSAVSLLYFYYCPCSSLRFEHVIVLRMADGQGVFGGYPPPVGTVPMLGRVPAGELIDSARHEPKLRTAEVIHSDMSWRRVSVLAWAVHRNGWAVLIRWPDGRENWRGYDRRYIRPALSLAAGLPPSPPRNMRRGNRHPGLREGLGLLRPQRLSTRRPHQSRTRTQLKLTSG